MTVKRGNSRSKEEGMKTSQKKFKKKREQLKIL
ncbi:hypothetical protein FHW74_000542 [Atlantibacter sp. RC6]|nr:hypothetical protein [Atlantibacter sp. RC6]